MSNFVEAQTAKSGKKNHLHFLLQRRHLTNYDSIGAEVVSSAAMSSFGQNRASGHRVGGKPFSPSATPGRPHPSGRTHNLDTMDTWTILVKNSGSRFMRHLGMRSIQNLGDRVPLDLCIRLEAGLNGLQAP